MTFHLRTAQDKPIAPRQFDAIMTNASGSGVFSRVSGNAIVSSARCRGPNELQLIARVRLTAAPSAGARDPQCEQEHNRSDCGVDGEADDARAEIEPRGDAEASCRG